MALTASRELNRFVDQELRSFSVAAAAKVFKGAIVGVERSTGHVRNLQAGDTFAGIAYEEVDNTNGSAGEVSVRLYTQGDFVLTTNGATQTWVGSAIYAVDDEATTVSPSQGASFVGVLMAVLGTNLGIVRIMPVGAQQVEHALQIPLVSSTSQASMVPVMVTQRAIKVMSVEVSFLTVPDQGLLDVGTTVADPDELVNAFNLATLASNVATLLVPVLRDIAKGQVVWAKVGQASATAGDGGLLSLRYVEVP
jgi:hypothetical protein